MSALSRRDFLRVVSLAGGGIALGIGLGGCAGEPAPWPNARSGVFQPNAFLQLGSDGTLTLAIHKAEMGQGVMTGLATLVAEELAIDPRTLRFEFALPHPDYRGDDAVMVTGGSASIASSFDTLRQAGAVLRELLTQAAANAWQAKPGDCVAEDGMIRLRDGSRALGYGALAEAAARLPVPASVALKERADWRLIGRYDARVDAAAKVDGSAQFSIDVQLPGVLVAVLLGCPHFGGSLRRVGAEDAIEQRSGGAPYQLGARGGAAGVDVDDKACAAGVGVLRLAQHLALEPHVLGEHRLGRRRGVRRVGGRREPGARGGGDARCGHGAQRQPRE